MRVSLGRRPEAGLLAGLSVHVDPCVVSQAFCSDVRCSDEVVLVWMLVRGGGAALGVETISSDDCRSI